MDDNARQLGLAPDRRVFAHSCLARTGYGAWSDFGPGGYRPSVRLTAAGLEQPLTQGCEGLLELSRPSTRKFREGGGPPGVPAGLPVVVRMRVPPRRPVLGAAWRTGAIAMSPRRRRRPGRQPGGSGPGADAPPRGSRCLAVVVQSGHTPGPGAARCGSSHAALDVIRGRALTGPFGKGNL